MTTLSSRYMPGQLYKFITSDTQNLCIQLIITCSDNKNRIVEKKIMRLFADVVNEKCYINTFSRFESFGQTSVHQGHILVQDV